MAFESEEEKQYWPDEVRAQVAAEEAELLEASMDDDACCIPRAIGSTALDAVQQPEATEERAARIHTAANSLRINKGQGREIEDREQARIDTLWDTGQESAEGAFYRVMGMRSEQFYGDPTFSFGSEKALSIAESIISEPHARNVSNFRGEILQSAMSHSGRQPEITESEAADLMRLIELRKKNK